MPNVPNVPGVPPLSSYSAALAPVLLVSDAINILREFGLFTQWGVFSAATGSIVLEPDNFVSIDYRQEWVVADYPLEQGAFESYDKVQTPFDARVRMSVGGATTDREAFLAEVAAIAGDTNLYNIVTPEVTYTSVNVERYEYRRTAANGVGLLVVDLILRQVRVNAVAAFSNVQAASGANPTPGGQVTAIPPGAGQPTTLPFLM